MKKEYDWLDDPFSARQDEKKQGSQPCLVVFVVVVLAIVAVIGLGVVLFSALMVRP